VHPEREPARARAMVEMLAQAFEADPHIDWLVRRDGDRRRSLRAFFQLAAVESLGRAGELHATSDGIAAAIWFRPGTATLDWSTQLRCAGRFVEAIGWRHLISRYLGLRQAMARHPDVPHYYLQTLGVAPSHRGQGLGSGLMEVLTARCDQEGVMACLETCNEDNLGFYERFGFRFHAEAGLPDGPRMWWLRRPAGPRK
jgi:GNAT superfamily N-acetyltransferase